MASGSRPLPTKRCSACAREFTWRKKWEKNWDEVKYCSDACRKGTPRMGRRFEVAILELLEARSAESSICPSEVARALGGETWRELMPQVREAAARLLGAGKLRVTQGTRSVDPLEASGPIRLRRP